MDYYPALCAVKWAGISGGWLRRKVKLLRLKGFPVWSANAASRGVENGAPFVYNWNIVFHGRERALVISRWHKDGNCKSCTRSLWLMGLVNEGLNLIVCPFCAEVQGLEPLNRCTGWASLKNWSGNVCILLIIRNLNNRKAGSDFYVFAKPKCRIPENAGFFGWLVCLLTWLNLKQMSDTLPS